MELSTVITAVVAVYGAVLSSYILYRDVRKGSAHVKVELSTGFLDYSGNLREPKLVLEAANTGDRTVTLQSPMLLISNKMFMVFPNPTGNAQFPHELLSGKNCLVWMGLPDLSNMLIQKGYKGVIKLRGVYRDQTGRSYQSKPFDVDTSEWVR